MHTTQTAWNEEKRRKKKYIYAHAHTHNKRKIVQRNTKKISLNNRISHKKMYQECSHMLSSSLLLFKRILYENNMHEDDEKYTLKSTVYQVYQFKNIEVHNWTGGRVRDKHGERERENCVCKLEFRKLRVTTQNY